MNDIILPEWEAHGEYEWRWRNLVVYKCVDEENTYHWEIWGHRHDTLEIFPVMKGTENSFDAAAAACVDMLTALMNLDTTSYMN